MGIETTRKQFRGEHEKKHFLWFLKRVSSSSIKNITLGLWKTFLPMRIYPLTILAHASTANKFNLGKKAKPIVLKHVSFGLPQHGLFYSCWNDVPNDAPNVTALSVLNLLYFCFSIPLRSLYFMYAYIHTHTHNKKIEYVCMCVCTNFNVVCCVQGQTETNQKWKWVECLCKSD